MLTGWDSNKKVRIRPGKQLIPSALADITLPVHLNSSSGVYGKDMAAMFSDLNPVDPYWDNVVLAMPMDGANGSTTFTDLKGKTVTRYGNAQISTAQSKFGGASGYFDGSGDYLAIATSADFNFGSENFTFEAWVVFSSTANEPHIVTLTDNSGYYEVRLQLSLGKLTAKIYHTNAYQVQIIGTTTISTGAWYHVAFVRNGNTHTIYLDGIADGAQSSSHSIPSRSYVAVVGQVLSVSPGLLYYLNGYIDDLRITKGVARYTANFTPPTRSIVTTSPTYTGLNPLAKKIALEIGDTGVEVPISILTQDWDNTDNTAENAKIYAVFEDLEDGNDFTFYWDFTHADNANVTEISSAPEAPAGEDALTVWSLASSDDLWLIATEFYTISGTVTVSAVATARRVVVFDESRIYQSFFSDASDGSYGCFVPSTGPFNIAMIGNAGEYPKIFSSVTAV